MKSVLLLAVLLLQLEVFFCFVEVGLYDDPAYPGKCFIASDMILEPGEHEHPNVACGQIICQKDGIARFETCGGEEILPNGCISLIDDKIISQKYPKCCERVIKCGSKSMGSRQLSSMSFLGSICLTFLYL